MRLRPVVPLFVLPVALSAAPLQVDLSIAGRNDAVAPGYQQWVVPGDRAHAATFGSVQAELTASNGVLVPTWWKGGAVEGGRLVVDGVTTERGGALQLRLTGLTPGRHTMVTYHNWTEQRPGGAPDAVEVRIGEAAEATAVITPSFRAATDDQATTGYVEFEADRSGAVRLTFSATGGGAPILCGFALDVPDPRRQALQPQPGHGDEHVDADDGQLTLSWSPAAGAVRHQVYYGQRAEAVASATPTSPAFRGNVTGAAYTVEGLRDLGDHFWRIDTVDASGAVTTGRLWRFRPRRLAFPGAEGYGRFAAGGRGGRLFTVTSLADRGPGTLREAVEAEGPRTVVFAVGGLITLESRLIIRHPYLTLAGQTAPGKGITLRGYNLGMLGTHDVIVRHVRVRPGDIAGVTLDGMGMASTDHSIIDHASISWSIDEAFSSRGARNITLQRTLISEALNAAGHKKYRPGTQHGYAASISGKIGSFHHNLLAHNSGRNWSLAGGLDQATRHAGWLDIRNNVVYNWQNRTTDGGAAKVNYVNNYYRPGPATKVFHLLKPERNNISGFGPQDYYVAGNIMEGHVDADDALGGVLEPEPYENFIVDQPFFDSHVTTHSAQAAYKHVLSDVGCSQPVLDEHDQRVLRETLDRTFTHRGSRTDLPGLPDSQEDVGGWEHYPEERRPDDWDTDGDGLPDWWERIHGLNTASVDGDTTDAHGDHDGDRYTNLEEYLDWMATPHRHVAPGAALAIDLETYTRGFTNRPKFRVDASTGGSATLQPDGRTVHFTAADRAILGIIQFTVTDAEGDTMTRTLGIAVY